MKRFLLTFLVMTFTTGMVFAECPERQTYQPRPQSQLQESGPDVCLESFEMCNNWARHYCRAGNHERMVNYILTNMKKRGMTITTAIIKSVAKRTLKNVGPPNTQTSE